MKTGPVIVIGAANADIKGFLDDRFEGPTSYPGRVVTSAGGVGRNIAHNLALLGLQTALVAMVGADHHGQSVTGITAAAGVDLSLVQTGEAPTGVYLAILDQKGQLMGAVNDMRAAEGLTAARLQTLTGKLTAASLLVADCNIPADSLSWLVNFAARTGLRLVLDAVSVPKAARLAALRGTAGIHVLVLNEDELAAVSGGASIEMAVAELARHGVENVVVHCGARGAIVATAGATPVAVDPIRPVRLVDVTGAGDSAVAGLVYGLMTGGDMVRAARLGQAAASLTVATAESVATGITAEKIARLAA